MYMCNPLLLDPSVPRVLIPSPARMGATDISANKHPCTSPSHARARARASINNNNNNNNVYLWISGKQGHAFYCASARKEPPCLPKLSHTFRGTTCRGGLMEALWRLRVPRTLTRPFHTQMSLEGHAVSPARAQREISTGPARVPVGH